MAIEVIMPKVDMDQETGTVVEWKKSNGDEVKVGEIILVIETDKVGIDIESMDSGIIDGIRGEPGDVIPIGTIIAYLLEPGEELPIVADQPEAENQKPVPAASAPPPDVKVTPVAQNVAASHGVDLGAVMGTGFQNQVTKADVEAHISTGVPAQQGENGKIYATPAARRIGREMGFDLAEISGTGPERRIQVADVENYMPITIGTQAADLSLMTATEADQVIPLVGMRRTIAERMTHSYQTIPHINFTSKVDMTSFNQARAEFKSYAEKSRQPKVSATAFLVKLVAIALQKHPYLNSSLKDDNIILHRDINIGVAVALDDGLIVPVVQDANLKPISQIGAEVKDLTVRAREHQLVPSDVSGGTFTISNLGPFGIEQFAAIINPPQSAILAVGATQNEPVVLDDSEIIARPIMRFTLSADHRIVDGAIAAHFVAELKALLENPILHTY